MTLLKSVRDSGKSTSFILSSHISKSGLSSLMLKYFLCHDIFKQAMAEFNLKLEDEEACDAGPGCYADKRALSILQSYLKGKISVQSAAKEITAMLPESSQYKTRGWEISRFGSLLCQMAQQIPYINPAQARLVQLIRSVSLSPKLSETSDDDACIPVPIYHLTI